MVRLVLRGGRWLFAAPLGSLWLCSRWHHEVLLVQVLLRAGQEGWSKGAWGERALLLLQQLQRQEPGSQGHQLQQLLLPPHLHTALPPLVEADMRRIMKILKKEYPEATTLPS